MVNGPLQENTSLKLWRKCYYGKLWKFFCSFKKPLEVNSPKFAHFKKHCWRHDSWFWRLFLCIYTFYFSFHHESQVREQQRSPTESDWGRVPPPGCDLRRWHQQGRQGLLQRPFCKGEVSQQGVRERVRVPQLVMLCRRWAHLQYFAGRTSHTRGTTAGYCVAGKCAQYCNIR